MPDSLAKILVWYWGRRGGGAEYALEMARALQARGAFELHLSLSRQNELFDDFASLGLPGCHVDTIKGRFGPALALARVPRMRRRLAGYLAAQRIDAVYGTMSTIWSGLAVGAVRAARYLHTVHDATPHLGERVPLPGFLVGREIAASDALVVLSEHVKGQVVRDYGYDEKRIWTVPHGPFATADGPGTPRQAPEGRPWRLMFFGRILAYKGLGLLLDAYADLVREQNVRLEIVGGGDLSPYESQLAELPGVAVQNRWVPNAEIGKVIAGADLVVLPYVEASQSGVAPLAYGAGVPVIATPVGGLVEQVRDGETGLVAEQLSAEALARSIAAMMADRALYRRCSAGALAAASGELSWPTAASKVAQAIGGMLLRA